GRISIFVDDVLVARNLGVGEATIPLPLSRQSSVIRVVNSENRPLMSSNFRAALEQQPTAEKIIAFSDLPVDAAADENSARIEAHVFIRGEASSPALANIRLIHSLTGATQTLDMEIRAADPRFIANPIGVPQAAETDLGWS